MAEFGQPLSYFIQSRNSGGIHLKGRTKWRIGQVLGQFVATLVARATDGILSHRGYSCNTAGLILPIIEYAHNTSGGEAIIGGFVHG